MSEAPEILAKRLRNQAGACRMLGSPLYGFLLERAAGDVEGGGVVLEAMNEVAFEPPGAAVALRLMGAVHRLVLEGRAQSLAAFYPSAGGHGPVEEAWPAFQETVASNLEEIQHRMHEPVQTNEVGRCAGLVGGFLEVARRTGLSLRLVEVGCSGGLNLRWDRYLYRAGDVSWGEPGAPVVLETFERPPELSGDVEIAERIGCDPYPVDAASPEGRLTLSSFVWPDQHERWTRLRGALEVASWVPVDIVHAGAAGFLREVLARPVDGVATVVFHSIVFQYLDADERSEAVALIAAAGARASADAPLAHLSMEPPLRHLKTWFGPVAEEWDAIFPEPSVPPGQEDLGVVHLRMWPDEPSPRLVGRAGYHGSPVWWQY
ncbi:MAG: DUF2332 domain-containing protein [Actinomycetota bacterium]